MTKQIFDRLVAAEWMENLQLVESPGQNGIMECRPAWRKGEHGQADGARKVVAFSRLYRELLKGGPLSIEEIKLIVTYGQGIAVQDGSEKI